MTKLAASDVFLSSTQGEDESDDLSFLDVDTVSGEVPEGSPKEFQGHLETIKISQIEFHPDNPNQMSRSQFAMLKQRISEAGFLHPISVVKIEKGSRQKYFLIDGEHRTKAAKALGYKELPAIIFDGPMFESEEIVFFLGSQANLLRGTISPEKFIPIYQRLSKKYTDDVIKDLMGFTQKAAWKMLTKGIAEGLPTEETKREFTKKAKDATPNELEQILKQVMSQYGSTLSCNFMVFSVEGKESIWIRATPELLDEVKALGTLVSDAHADITEPLLAAVRQAVSTFNKT